MKKTLLYDTRTAAAQGGDMLHLEYFLLAEDAPDGTTRYGIAIGCTRAGAAAEWARAADVTSCRAWAEALLRRLADGVVTPVSLREILEDAL